MPPHRPLTDLCIISVLKQLTPNGQMKASWMSPRSRRLARAANRRRKSLVIRTKNTYRRTEHLFRSSNYSDHCMQLLEGSVPFVRYLLNSRYCKWSCLLLWDAIKDRPDSPSLTTANHIVFIFSAVVDLKFAAHGRSEDIDILTALLQHPQWSGQLTDLVLARENIIKYHDFDLARRVTAALNRLSALQLLSVKNFAYLNFLELTVKHQLKVMAIHYDPFFSSPEQSTSNGLIGKMPITVSHKTQQNDFLRSFRSQCSTVTKKQLQLHLSCDYNHKNDPCTTEDQLFRLSEFECSRIVGYRFLRCTSEWQDEVIPSLVTRLTSLVSLGIAISVAPRTYNLEPLFTALSQLKQLLYLHLNVQFHMEFRLSNVPPQAVSDKLAVQLPSVRALQLELSICSHSQVAWLSLAQTLPNCQGVYLLRYTCSACNVSLRHFTEGLANYLDNSSSEGGGGGGVTRSVALNCLRAVLPVLHQGVYPSKLIFEHGWPARHESSLEQLLLLQQ